MADPEDKSIKDAIDALVRASRPTSVLGSWASSIADALSPPPSISSIAAALYAPPPAPIIQDRWFPDQTIHIDGYTFENCRFDRCTLVTEMATFVFKNCYIAADCRLLFKGPALKIVKLLMHLLGMQGRLPVREDERGLLVNVKPDGTFSLE